MYVPPMAIISPTTIRAKFFTMSGAGVCGGSVNHVPPAAIPTLKYKAMYASPIHSRNVRLIML